MFLLYSFLLAVAFLLLLPRFIFDWLRHGKYAAGFWERTGDVPVIKADKERPVIWIHCVSVGETQAARSIIGALKNRYPHFRVVVSTTTQTGHQIARTLYAREAEQIIYFPFDFRFCVRRVFNRINPRAVLILETELWANFLRECNERQIPVALINGRLSERSVRRYRKIKFFMRRAVNLLTLAVMQTEPDAERLRALGIEDARVRISGNVKFDVATKPDDATAKDFAKRFDFISARPVIIAASTHQPEEQIVLDAFQTLLTNRNSHSRLIIVPRHPERFNEVAAQCENFAARRNLIFVRRSQAASVNDSLSDIILLDSIGELASLYTNARIVFVGGSLIPHGGQNILEPAAAGAAIVTGAYTFNFAAIIETFSRADALIQLPLTESNEHAASELSRAFDKLLSDHSLHRNMTSRARRVVTENQGATARTLDALAPMFDNL